MRLDARHDPIARRYHVYDAERCVMRQYIVWVDDDTNEYGEYITAWDIATRRIRKVAIYPERLLVIFNPVEDADDAAISDNAVAGHKERA